MGVGLVNGKDGKLAPQDQTNRAEVATILYRFNMLFPYSKRNARRWLSGRIL